MLNARVLASCAPALLDRVRTPSLRRPVALALHSSIICIGHCICTNACLRMFYVVLNAAVCHSCRWRRRQRLYRHRPPARDGAKVLWPRRRPLPGDAGAGKFLLLLLSTSTASVSSPPPMANWFLCVSEIRFFFRFLE